jgi:uncharacterized protein with GYD domain
LEGTVPKFLVIGSYTAEGAKGVLAEGGTGRRKATEQLISSIGGKVESYYFGLGADDFYLIADVPSTEAIVAATLTGASHGGLTARTIPLLSPEQIDAAIRISPSYRKPGS